MGGPSRAQSVKPNIVFILADDLGYADVSCYGQRDYTTPNIDRLAIEGLRSTQGYANSAVCSATRLVLITGRYQYRLAAGLEEPIGPTSPRNVGLPPSHPTLPSLLKKVGYGTALVGKWHLGFLPDFSALKSGYDHFFGIFPGAADYFNHGPNALRDLPFGFPGRLIYGQLHEQEVPVERHSYMTNLLGDRAVQTIKGYARSREPFLLSLHFTAPSLGLEGTLAGERAGLEVLSVLVNPISTAWLCQRRPNQSVDALVGLSIFPGSGPGDVSVSGAHGPPLSNLGARYVSHFLVVLSGRPSCSVSCSRRRVPRNFY